MKTVLFLTHPQEECGVHQFGKLVFSGLAASQKYTFRYCAVSSPEEVQVAVQEVKPSAVLVNWHRSTMAWAPQDLFWSLGVPTIGIMHEMTEELGNKSTDVQFDYYITHDPSARFSNPIYFSSARPVPPFDKHVAPPARLTIGTFGFASPSKDFAGLVARINAEFDDCLIRINMPNSFFNDADGASARAVAERCRKAITKPNIDLVVSHDFMPVDRIIEFLAGNSLNAFFYSDQYGRGISSATDLAIAAGRPIALRRVPMFRHLFDVDPGMFVEQRSLKEILESGTEAISACRAKWSLGQVCKDYEAALDNILPDWGTAEPMRVRRQWVKRVAVLVEDLEPADRARATASRVEADALLATSEARIKSLTDALALARQSAALQSAENETLALALVQAERDVALQSAKKVDIETQFIAVSAELSTIRAGVAWKAADKLQGLLGFMGDPIGAYRVNRKARRIQHRYLKQIRLPRPWGAEVKPVRSAKALWRKLQGRLPFLQKARKKPLNYKKQALADLQVIAAALSDPGRIFGPPHLAKLKAAIGATDRHREEVLTKKRLAPEVRSALLEAEIVSCLAVEISDKRDAEPKAARHLIVVDARCLQDPNYLGRGVGLHAAFALRALFEERTAGEKVLLLLDPDGREIAADVRRCCDGVIFSAAALDLRRVAKFVSLSPMTASIAPLAPFLLQPGIHKTALIYDFIPLRFPEFYLVRPHISVEYRARLCALQRYDTFLPISRATAAELGRIFPKLNSARVRFTGVVNPLELDIDGPVEADTLPSGHILAPTGGDPRKNLLAVIAAEGLRRVWGKKAKSIVAVGRTTQAQRTKAMKLANAIGIPRADLIFMQNVSNAHLAALYRRAAVCVVPSRAEGFSIPVVEAAACGTPVIVSDIPAHLELVGRGWWAVPARKPAAFAQAIERALRSRKKTNARQLKRIADISEAEAVQRRLAIGFRARPAETAHREAARSIDASPRRLRIAVATPWPPQRSGIADYSRQMLNALAEVADVTALINCDDQVQDPAIKTRPISAAAYLDGSYDYVVNVLGNSHFHLPIIEYLVAFGGPVLAHDTRMIEFYLYLHGKYWVARLMSTSGRQIDAEDISDYVLNLNTLPNLGYRTIARVAAPMLVHSQQIGRRIRGETGIGPIALPFVPYNLSPASDLGPDKRAAARQRFQLEDDVLHVGTFGFVDIRTKGIDIVIEAIAWLAQWNQKVKLHIVGGLPPSLPQKLQRLASESGAGETLVFHDHISPQDYKDMLLAVDVALQLRTSPLANLSGALMDCIAHGVTTVATRSMKEEIAAPDYVVALPDKFSPLLIAENLIAADQWRRGNIQSIEGMREDYLEARSMRNYAVSFLQALENWTANNHD